MNKDIFLKKHYWDIIPQLKEKLGVENIFALPRLKKAIVNIGLSNNRFEKEKIAEIKKNLSLILGQIPQEVKAKKSIASFKVRKGQIIALKATLRGERMWSFLSKLFHIALPRQRDFRGLHKKSLDERGILHIGLEDYTVFPDIYPEEVKTPSGLSVDVISTAKNKKEARILFEALGVIFETEEARKIREEAQKKAKEEARLREEKIKLYKKQLAEQAEEPKTQEKEGASETQEETKTE